jgi:predicted HicB family RNase H-like nuclease
MDFLEGANMTQLAQQTYREETDGGYATQTIPLPATRDRKQEVYRVASELFRQGPDWVTFFREILGVEGVARKLFVAPDEYLAFERSEQYSEIQQMLAKLRGRNPGAADDKEPTRVITVRLPKSLHESLRAEAHDRNTSMNRLCISKLLQVIDDEFVVAE